MRTISTCLLLAIATVVSPVWAGVIFVDNQPAFDASSNTTLRATFEGFSQVSDTANIADPYTEGGVTFSHPSNLYIAAPTGAAVTVGDIEFPTTSNVLTASGNEDITMTFAGPAPTAVGFASFTNRFNAPVVSVFDTSNALIGSFTLTQATNSAGFVGILSTVGIGSVRWLADRGGLKDTAIDNVLVGSVPEPSTWALMLAGVALLARRARHRSS